MVGHHSDYPALRARVAIAALDTAQDTTRIAERFGLTPQEVEAWRDRLIARAPELFTPRSAVSAMAEIARLQDKIRLLQRSEQRRFQEIAAMTRIAEGQSWRVSPRAALDRIVRILPHPPRIRASILARMSPKTKSRIKRLLGRVT